MSLSPVPAFQPPRFVRVQDLGPLPPHEIVLRPYQLRWVNDQGRFAIAVKGAQIGYSIATAAWAVERCLRYSDRIIVFLSRSERQSKELGRKAKQWVDAFQGVTSELTTKRFKTTEFLQHELRFGNRSRIICLAANPETARGYSGDIVLDEFAFHQDGGHAVFKAAYRQVSAGFSIRILSTPNGRAGKFYELARLLNLSDGRRPKRQPIKPSLADSAKPGTSAWSGHWCDIYLAVEEGCPFNPDLIRSGCDEDTWQQEYCCNFLAGGSQLISSELFESNVNEGANAGDPIGDRDSLYAGWDVSRFKDLSVVWFESLAEDVTWTRGVIVMPHVSTPEQIELIKPYMPMVRSMNVDMSGMGLAIYEPLAKLFPGKVQGVTFTAPIKEKLAVHAKRRLESKLCRIPDETIIRHSFCSIQKTTNAIGQARYDVGDQNTPDSGHGDHWWAFCLAEAAADMPKTAKTIVRPGLTSPAKGTQEELWNKVARGVPLTEAEIDRLK